MYAVVELLGNDFWKNKAKLNDIDAAHYALMQTRLEIDLVNRLGVINYHGFNYLATLFGRSFKLQRDLIKLVKAANLGKYQDKFLELYHSELSIDPKLIYPNMKDMLEALLPAAQVAAKCAADQYPSPHRDECYLDWDTINANFKVASK